MICKHCGQPNEGDSTYCDSCGGALQGPALESGESYDDWGATPVSSFLGVLDPGSTVAGYQIIGELGEGGMGTVYHARHINDFSEVALKVLAPHLVRKPAILARFKQEAGLQMALQHTHVVRVYELVEEDPIHAIVMEYVDGVTLEQMIHEHTGPMVPSRIKAVMLPVLAAVGYAHSKGVVHRDLKPSNIMLTTVDGRDTAKVTDFGIAKALSDGGVETATGSKLGTVWYMAPEQCKSSKDVDARSDVYSLGVTLYEARVDRVPFEGETTEQVFMKILERDPIPPRRRNPSISRDQETVIGKAMERDRGRRYGSMAELAEDLRRLSAGEPVAARPPGRIRRSARWLRRHRRASAGAATALLIGLGALTLALGAHWREGRIEAAEQRFSPIREALGFPSRTFRHATWEWAIAADPAEPSNYMIRAVLAVDASELEEASAALESCLERRSPSGETDLEAEASYLLGLVQLALANQLGDETERAQLLESARSALARVGEFDPLSPETLVWRSVPPATIEADRAATLLLQTELNAEHHITHLYRALEIAVDLHRGGCWRRRESAGF